jgi:hypothetical protein
MAEGGTRRTEEDCIGVFMRRRRKRVTGGWTKLRGTGGKIRGYPRAGVVKIARGERLEFGRTRALA